MPVNIIDTLKPKNGGSFPIVEAIDVFVENYGNLAEAVSHFATDVMIEAINTVLRGKANTSDVNTAVANLQGQIDQIVISASAEAVVAPEVAAARVNDFGVSYSTLKPRLDNKDLTDDTYRKLIDNNLFYADNLGYTTGYYYDTSGIKREAEGWGYTEGLIAVEENTVYKAVMNDLVPFFCNFYNTNSEYISSSTINSGSILTPANAAYLRVSIPKTRFDSFRLSKGNYINYIQRVENRETAIENTIDASKTNDYNTEFDTLKTRLDIKDQADDIARKYLDNNIYYADYYNFTQGYYYYTSDAKRAADDWGYTEFIPVKPNTRYVFTTDTMADCFCNMYNENKEYISSAAPGTEVTTTASTAYIRMSVLINRIKSFKLSEGEYVNNISKLDANVSNIAKAVDEINQSIDNNIYDITRDGYTEGYYYTVGGNKLPAADWCYIDLFSVNANTTYAIYTPSSSTCFICYYDSEENFISGLTSATGFTTPSNAAYVRISVPLVRIAVFKLAIEKYIVYGRDAYYRNATITCGVGKQFTRLRDAVEEGVRIGGEVIVYPGTYDLTEEFATELSQTLTRQIGISLSNNVHVKFMAGAYVVANFDGSDDSIYNYFSPFYTIGSFTLENAHIVASNCRYCVHDEMSGTGVYQTKYINCHMEYSNEVENVKYVQAIGGGLGKNGIVEIDGGYYKSSTTVGYSSYGTYGTAQNCQIPISYHNGSAADCNNKIIIKNVYFADRGWLRIGNYGGSTIKTPIEVNNCSFGLPIVEMYETVSSVNRNFDVTAYNNVSRHEEVPFDFGRVIDIYTNSD